MYLCITKDRDLKYLQFAVALQLLHESVIVERISIIFASLGICKLFFERVIPTGLFFISVTLYVNSFSRPSGPYCLSYLPL